MKTYPKVDAAAAALVVLRKQPVSGSWVNYYATARNFLLALLPGKYRDDDIAALLVQTIATEVPQEMAAIGGSAPEMELLRRCRVAYRAQKSRGVLADYINPRNGITYRYEKRYKRSEQYDQ